MNEQKLNRVVPFILKLVPYKLRHAVHMGPHTLQCTATEVQLPGEDWSPGEGGTKHGTLHSLRVFVDCKVRPLGRGIIMSGMPEQDN